MQTEKIPASAVQIGDFIASTRDGSYRQVTDLAPRATSVYITFQGGARIRPRFVTPLWRAIPVDHFTGQIIADAREAQAARDQEEAHSFDPSWIPEESPNVDPSDAILRVFHAFEEAGLPAGDVAERSALMIRAARLVQDAFVEAGIGADRITGTLARADLLATIRGELKTRSEILEGMPAGDPAEGLARWSPPSSLSLAEYAVEQMILDGRADAERAKFERERQPARGRGQL